MEEARRCSSNVRALVIRACPRRPGYDRIDKNSENLDEEEERNGILPKECCSQTVIKFRAQTR